MRLRHLGEEAGEAVAWTHACAVGEEGRSPRLAMRLCRGSGRGGDSSRRPELGNLLGLWERHGMGLVLYGEKDITFLVADIGAESFLVTNSLMPGIVTKCMTFL